MSTEPHAQNLAAARYLDVGSTQNAPSLVAGPQAKPASPFLRILPLEGALTVDIRLLIMGTGKTRNYRIWGVKPLSPSVGKVSADVSLQCLAFGSCTNGTAGGGVAGDAIINTGTAATSEFTCHTITVTPTDVGTTPKGPATPINTAYGEGTWTVYSPATNGEEAILFGASLGKFTGLIIEAVGGGTDLFNALVGRNVP